VRWTAPSGARVFAAGSLQFSWALDDYGTRNMGHAQPADPRVQLLVANALADLTAPASPRALAGDVDGDLIVPAVQLADDPRLVGAIVFARRGSEPFKIGDPGVRRICATRVRPCKPWRVRKGGAFRLGAVAVDAWGRSALVLSDPVNVVADG
jgi:hypothetical protein